MIFKKGKKMRSMLGVSFVACMAFLALAVWGWKLPLADLLQFFLITVILLLVLIGSAALVVFIFKWLARLGGHDRD